MQGSSGIPQVAFHPVFFRTSYSYSHSYFLVEIFLSLVLINRDTTRQNQLVNIFCFFFFLKHWSILKPPGLNPSTPWPMGSCDNSMTYITGFHSDRHSPCLLIQGGENDEGETLSDCWIMEVHTSEWKQVCILLTQAHRQRVIVVSLCVCVCYTTYSL